MLVYIRVKNYIFLGYIFFIIYILFVPHHNFVCYNTHTHQMSSKWMPLFSTVTYSATPKFEEIKTKTTNDCVESMQFDADEEVSIASKVHKIIGPVLHNPVVVAAYISSIVLSIETVDSLVVTEKRLMQFISTLNKQYITGSNMREILKLLFASPVLDVVSKALAGKMLCSVVFDKSHEMSSFTSSHLMNGDSIALLGEMYEVSSGEIKIPCFNQVVIHLPPWTYYFKSIQATKSSSCGYWCKMANASNPFILLYNPLTSIITIVGRHEIIATSRESLSSILSKW